MVASSVREGHEAQVGPSRAPTPRTPAASLPTRRRRRLRCPVFFSRPRSRLRTATAHRLDVDRALPVDADRAQPVDDLVGALPRHVGKDDITRRQERATAEHGEAVRTASSPCRASTTAPDSSPGTKIRKCSTLPSCRCPGSTTFRTDGPACLRARRCAPSPDARALGRPRDSAGGGHQLGDLHGVERRALAQVVAADEQRQPAALRRRPGPGGSGRRSSGPCRPPAAAWVRRRASTPGAVASSSVARATDSGRANSTLSDSECPVNTGTRTQVPDTSRSGMSRILRLSLRSFCSSSVSKEPSSTTEPAIGSTLNAIGATYFSGSGNWHGAAVVHQLGRPVDDLAHLLVQLVDAGQPAAGDRLVGAGHDPDAAPLHRAAA